MCCSNQWRLPPGLPLGQSEASCLIYGMSKVAMEIGAVDTEMPLDRLAAEVLR